MYRLIGLTYPHEKATLNPILITLFFCVKSELQVLQFKIPLSVKRRLSKTLSRFSKFPIIINVIRHTNIGRVCLLENVR